MRRIDSIDNELPRQHRHSRRRDETGAQALHPGYGFLSENAEFAAQVEAAGLVWVGPLRQRHCSMGDKLAAKEMARAAGVPTPPSCTDPGEAGRVGYPLMVKAVRRRRRQGHAYRDRRLSNWTRPSKAAAPRSGRRIWRRSTSFSSAMSRHHATLRSKFLATSTATRCTWASVSVPSAPTPEIDRRITLPFMDDEMRVAMTCAALALGRVLGYQSAARSSFSWIMRRGDSFPRSQYPSPG